MKKNPIILMFALVAILVSSCNDNSTIPPVPNPPKTVTTLQPDSVVIELYEGHDHLKRGTQPEVGEVFWSNRNGGFHANPLTEHFPMSSYQKMVYTKQADGSYKPSPMYDTTFRMQSSPQKNGNWYGVVIKVYGEGGKRLDLEYKDEQHRNSTQVFYQVHNLRPIEQTIPANVVARDTLFNINDFDTEDSDEMEIKQKLIDKGFVGDLTLNYQPVATWGPDSSTTKAFYFWYYDRPTDDSKELLQTPVGFRGVVAGRIPYLSYDVRMTIVTDSPKGEVQNSVSLTKEQESKAVFTIDIPFRNVFEGKGWGVPTGNSDLLNIVYDAEYRYLPTPVDRIFENRLVYIPVLREFPQYSVKQLREWYELDSEISIEQGNFWL